MLDHVDSYVAMEASLRLKRKLARENVGVFIYGGFVQHKPVLLTIYSSKPIACPEEWAGYQVYYEVKPWL